MKTIFALLVALLILSACDTNTTALPDGAALSTLGVNVGYLGDASSPASSLIDNSFKPADPFPLSTNALNFDATWATVSLVAARVGVVDLVFAQPRNFLACFEYRADLEDNTVLGDNPNPNVRDGRWSQVCVTSDPTQQQSYGLTSSTTVTIAASEFVDVRMAYGAESDERFDWTRFYVLTLETKDECKEGAWEALGFKNQGQCIASIMANESSVQ